MHFAIFSYQYTSIMPWYLLCCNLCQPGYQICIKQLDGMEQYKQDETLQSGTMELPGQFYIHLIVLLSTYTHMDIQAHDCALAHTCLQH